MEPSLQNLVRTSVVVVIDNDMAELDVTRRKLSKGFSERYVALTVHQDSSLALLSGYRDSSTPMLFFRTRSPYSAKTVLSLEYIDARDMFEYFTSGLDHP